MSIRYGIQVKVFNQHTKEYVWLWVHPSGTTAPYSWTDEAYAHRMKGMMYPESSRDFVRVQPFPEGERSESF